MTVRVVDAQPDDHNDKYENNDNVDENSNDDDHNNNDKWQ